MNWISFLTYLGMGYAAYYLVVFGIDSMPSRGMDSSRQAPLLIFSELVEPEKVSLEDFTSGELTGAGIPASVGLGGVSLKELFDLARKDAVEYTRSVSF